MLAHTIFAVIQLEAGWKSTWVNNIPLRGGFRANLQTAWQDTGPARKFVFAVHIIEDGSSRLAHTKSFVTTPAPTGWPAVEVAYLGRRKEPLVFLDLQENPLSAPKFISFKNAKPCEEPELKELLSPFWDPFSPHRCLIHKGRLMNSAMAPAAGFTFEKTGIGPWNSFIRTLDVTEKRKLIFGPWVEEPYSGPDAITLQEGAGTNAFKVSLKKQNFRLRGHRVSFTKQDVLTIDGLEVNGIERGKDEITGDELIAALLRNRLKAISVNFAGRTVDIPKYLVADCFNVHFGEGYAEAWLSGRQKDLFIQIPGSDAGSGYFATFRIRRDGKVTRYIERL